MNQIVKLIIFDLDGTLVDAYKAVTSSVNHALQEMGYDTLDLETIKKNVGWGERNLIERFVDVGDVDKTLSIFRQHHRFSIKTGVKSLPGARKLILRLKEDGFYLAIASNRPTRFTHMILKQLDMLNHFDYVLCADKVERPKPAADLIEHILKKFTLTTDQAIYVGDMAIDVQAGNNAGVKTVAVTTGSSHRDEIEQHQPFAVITGIGCVLQLLEKDEFQQVNKIS